MNRLVIPALGILCVAPGCATRRVAIESNPSGALVRVDGMERRTPCTLRLPRGRHEVAVMMNTGSVQRVVTPRGPGPWKASAQFVGKTGAYILYGVSAPFIFVGTFSSAVLAGVGDSVTAGSEAEACALLVLVVGAAGGLGIGLPLRAAGEFLDDISDIDEPVLFVDFTAAAPPDGR